MLYSEIKDLSVAELMLKKKELRASAFEARMKNSMGQLPNPMTIRTARRDVARLNTVLTARAKSSTSGASGADPVSDMRNEASVTKKKAAVKKAKA